MPEHPDSVWLHCVNPICISEDNEDEYWICGGCPVCEEEEE
jgi:hypothetical protein